VAVVSSLGAQLGIETPGGPGLCGALIFGLFGASGSIVLGSLFVAILKVLQWLIYKLEENSNAVCKAITMAMCCLCEMLLKLYNSYAFVHVGLDGLGYLGAAPVTVEVFKKGGNMTLATDVALRDVLQVCKSVSMYSLMLLGVILGPMLGVFDYDFFDGAFAMQIVAPMICAAMGPFTAYMMTLTLGRLLEASVSTLLVLRIEHHEAFQKAQPEFCNRLEEVMPADGEERELLRDET